MIFVARERGVDRGRIISPLRTKDGERLAEALLSLSWRFFITREARDRERLQEREKEIERNEERFTSPLDGIGFCRERGRDEKKKRKMKKKEEEK